MVTLTGTFTRLDGTPASGTVRVTPSRSPILDSDGKIVISGPQVFPLDKDGKLNVTIPASDDPDLGPAFTYSIDVNLAHASWKISKVWIPHGSSTVDLSEIGDYQPVPGVATRVVTIPADGADGQVLVWDGAGFSWDYPPEGPQGPKGDLDAEQLAGAPRLTNLVHDTTWVVQANATIHSQEAGAVAFTATAQYGSIRAGTYMGSTPVYYVSAEVKTTSSLVYFGTGAAPTYHSGSGDWERLTARITLTGTAPYQVSDRRSSGWDQIELRDPVLINLTEVFGAGREPSREYMNALMAKHGHYIGGVDQFAVGDALQALTVAGPGMSLRHDTTVGTRVLLDHPGGTTMLHGDTGWRNIDDLVTTGEAYPGQPTKIRRINDQIYFTLRRDAVTIGNASTILTLPSGWYTGVGNERMYLSGAQGNSHLLFRINGTPSGLFGQVQPLESGIADASLYLNANWATTIPWPTTLPGTPA